MEIGEWRRVSLLVVSGRRGSRRPVDSDVHDERMANQPLLVGTIEVDADEVERLLQRQGSGRKVGQPPEEAPSVVWIDVDLKGEDLTSQDAFTHQVDEQASDMGAIVTGRPHSVPPSEREASALVCSQCS